MLVIEIEIYAESGSISIPHTPLKAQRSLFQERTPRASGIIA